MSKYYGYLLFFLYFRVDDVIQGDLMLDNGKLRIIFVRFRKDVNLYSSVDVNLDTFFLYNRVLLNMLHGFEFISSISTQPLNFILIVTLVT